MNTTLTFSDKLLERKQRHLMPNLFHFYRQPPAIVRGKMQHLFDETERRYLDCYSGVGVVSAGHCNPYIVEAMIEQLSTLQHTTTIYLTEPMLELAERLAATTNSDLPRVFFCNSGSEANDGAMLMARNFTGRRKILALNNALHGRTHATMGFTHITMWRTDAYPFADTLFADGYSLGIEAIKEVLNGTDEIPAAIIVEPIQGNGGIQIPPTDFMRALRNLCDENGMLLIADEVQTGVNRTGRFWAMDEHAVRPDIIVSAKALGNGQPVAAILANERVAQAQTRPGASTFGGNPVSMAAALATLEYHDTHNLAIRARRLGARLENGLNELKQAFDCVADVRGRGLMLGMEIQRDSTEETCAFVDQLLEDMKDRGFLIGKTGVNRNVLTFMPPLVIDPGDIDDLLAALHWSIKSIE